MKHLKIYESFRPYIDRRVLNSRKQELGPIYKDVQIRIDLEKIKHASDRQYRHGFNINNGKIDDDDIRETVELAIEEITIALMQDRFNICTYEDDYPTPGIRAGDPNRFVIKNKKTDLNIVCELTPGDNEFTLTVITVMTSKNFRTYPGQYSVEV